MQRSLKEYGFKFSFNDIKVIVMFDNIKIATMKPQFELRGISYEVEIGENKTICEIDDLKLLLVNLVNK